MNVDARARTASPSGGRAVPPGRHQQQRSHHCKQPRTEEPVCTEQTHTHSSGQRRTDEAEKKGEPGHLVIAKQGSWTCPGRRRRSEPIIIMFSWVKQEQGGRNKEGEMYQTVTEGLQTLYTKKLLPLEETYLFHDFHSPALEPADFQSKPMVLLVGQYSTGKTTFIRCGIAWILLKSTRR